jgi:hypothetical protein
MTLYLLSNYGPVVVGLAEGFRDLDFDFFLEVAEARVIATP